MTEDQRNHTITFDPTDKCDLGFVGTAVERMLHRNKINDGDLLGKTGESILRFEYHWEVTQDNLKKIKGIDRFDSNFFRDCAEWIVEQGAGEEYIEEDGAFLASSFLNFVEELVNGGFQVPKAA